MKDRLVHTQSSRTDVPLQRPVKLGPVGLSRVVRAVAFRTRRPRRYVWRLAYRLRYPSIGKEELIRDISRAVEQRKGYALGKIGTSQKYRVKRACATAAFLRNFLFQTF